MKIMKKNILISMAMVVSLLSGCDYNEKYFDGLKEGDNPTDVKKMEYILAVDDYATIANNSTNKTLAQATGVVAELAALKTNLYFTNNVPASTYVPAFLKTKWYTADEGSSIKLTYNKVVNLPDYIQQLDKASIYKVTNDDYISVWGTSFPFFSPSETASKHVPSILLAALPTAKANDIALVDYNESASEPSGSVVAVNQPFEGYWTANLNVAAVEGWANVITKGTYAWNGKVYTGNCYLQASAYKHAAGESEIYMVSPIFSVAKDMHLKFDACYGNYVTQGGRLSVLISTDLAGTTKENILAATWDDITSAVNIPIPTTTYGTLANVCDYDLSQKYQGKKIYIAFRYNGDSNTGATTTIQLDNVVVKSEASGNSENVYTATNNLYQFDGTQWKVYSGATSLKKADFKDMGSSYDNFSATMNPDSYLPVFLARKYPYAQEGDVKAIAYKYYDSTSKLTSVKADEYSFSFGAWHKTSSVQTVTDQFVYSKGKWNYDPSTVIELTPTKTNATTVLYMQTATDWVWENIDVKKLNASKKGEGYVTSYGNNEYYSGCSAYYGNVDMRVASARGQYSAGYNGMTDEQVTALMQEHLIEVMAGTLAVLHPDAVPVDGIEVLYTVKVGIYTGVTVSKCTHQIIYKVTSKGKFEYVKDSFKPL